MIATCTQGKVLTDYADYILLFYCHFLCVTVNNSAFILIIYLFINLMYALARPHDSREQEKRIIFCV